ncbi:MAG: hypothetical protein HYR55_14685 [Acidobacteria bacterium]|nr:hypothetical protein [Acidobacteriota bacterium]MBI3655898.1 hypothetical protein [Acidobacteriota bacterium]
MRTWKSKAVLLSILFLALVLVSGSRVAWALAGTTEGRAADGEVPDPGTAGPLTVTRTEYRLDNDDYQLTCRDRVTGNPRTFPVEVVGSVHAPEDLSGGPFPVVLFLHGRHATCQMGVAEYYQWPCPDGRTPIWSYQGYDYISDVLASWGYIVLSISANGINAIDNNCTDYGLDRRGELIHYHLDRWREFNTVGGDPFGTRFVGKLDFNRVGLMGHSRGGGGIASAYKQNLEREDPYGIKAMLPLAAVNFQRPRITNSTLLVILPYCDGDVSDLQAAWYYDDARYEVAGDLASKHYLLEMGGNHNYYNTIWTVARVADDWRYDTRRLVDPYCSNLRRDDGGRYTPEEVRRIGLAYIGGFFRAYVGDEGALSPIFTGQAPQPPSVGDVDIHMTYHAPDAATTRRDVDRVVSDASLTTNTLGGAVTQSGLDPFNTCIPQRVVRPHTNCGPFEANIYARQLRFAWSDATARYRSEIPDGARDLSAFAGISFRAGVNYCETRDGGNCDSRNPVGEPQDFSVILSDGRGASASARVSDYSTALYYPPSQEFYFPSPGIEGGQKIILNTVRIPLSAFDGLDLADIRAVEFAFDQRPQGALLLTDLAFFSDGISTVK